MSTAVVNGKSGVVPGRRKRNDSILDFAKDEFIQEVDSVELPGIGEVQVPVVKGNFHAIPARCQQFIARYVNILRPNGVYLCDGSKDEAEELTEKLVDRGTLVKLDKMKNCYLCCTDPADVARVESKTFIVTPDRYQTVPHVAPGCKGILGQWMSPDDSDKELQDRLPGSMKGRVMYVIPFSMGPVGGPLSKNGVQLTDFNYVVLSMRIMTRISPLVWKSIHKSGEFVECVHTIGLPRPTQRKVINHWPCNPEKIIITHFPAERRVISYGSGYGGNSLLGKKCFALRIASMIARDEGWLAEHMLIMGVTPPDSTEERYIAAAFPSACGKTNMSMMTPSLPGWKIRCIGDDIAWMRFDKDGRLRAINPEAGFFGVAPGTNMKTNPVAMETAATNTIFTNVAMTEDGGVFWEGMEKEVDPAMNITTWLGEQWKVGMPGKAAHPNSRFCTPAAQCPIIHPAWEDPAGFPIDAIVFGGRRPEGVPLIFEALDWQHAVLIGASIKSEATASAEHSGKQIMHDPMAMRPFMGYNFGEYLSHWLSLEQPGRHMPKVFHVNWFRLNQDGKFLWPGFGDNVRVVDWICRRIAGEEETAVPSAIGLLPAEGSINLDGLSKIDWSELFSLPKEYWMADIAETRKFLEEQVGSDLPSAIVHQLAELEAKIAAM